MREFSSQFKNELEAFMLLREKTVSPGTLRIDSLALREFDKYLIDSEVSDREVSEAVVNGWIKVLFQTRPAMKVANLLGHLRNFLRYLRFYGVVVHLPADPKYSADYVPYIFADTEVEIILRAADMLSENYGKGFHKLKKDIPMEIAMILRMIYGCGFRIGELLAARVYDVNFKNGSVFLKDTKNKKQRLVPMSRSLSEMLELYCRAIGIKEKPESYLFPGYEQGKPLDPSTLFRHFNGILKDTGIYVEPPKRRRGQCPHCLRHFFAIKSFAQAEQAGRSIADSIPYLSVYLGHSDLGGTEKYLKFGGDMFPKFTNLFEQYSENVFSEAAYEE
jgi:integrase